MAKVDPALWRDMMAYLRRKHAPICRQWFEELRPIGLDAGLLKVSTSNSIQQNYLQRKCLDHFTEAAQAATGALVAVRFLNGEPVPAEHPAPERSGRLPAATLPLAVPGGLARDGRGLEPAEVAAMTAPAPAAGRLPPLPAPVAVHPRAGPRPDAALDHPEVAFEAPIITPDYSFETFVTGPGNQLAYAAAIAVANHPGTTYNPLFVHGGVGLGKTHLLQAICAQIMQQQKGVRICYLSCDAFINHFLDAVQRGLMDQFRHRYRDVDVLVIDDIHFLANRERTQEEFFHTFNALHQARKQLVLSSDAPPSEIPQLEQRLVSRFQWGLVAPIARPDYDTRLAIVRAKAQLRGLTLPDDVTAYIATRIDSNARELEGALTTIQAHALLHNQPVELALAQQALGEPRGNGRGQITLQTIVEAVTAFYSVKLSDLQSKRRHKSITLPRQVCMWLARKHTRFSLQEIGAYFGGRDHTTVMHSIQTVDDRSATDPSFSQQVRDIDHTLAPVALTK